MIRRRLSLLAGIMLVSSLPLAAQQGASFGVDVNALNATESFRIGLEAYNRFAFNEAIMSLEQALSYKPGEGLILDWLGKAYYRSGLEEIALRQWQAAVQTYPPASPEAVIINSRIEVVQNRRSLFSVLNDSPRYVEAGVFQGKYDNTVIFRQPSSILACEDGSVWVTAYGSNEIVRLDVQGYIRTRRRGSLAGFDRPYDIARGIDGRLYVSEFRGGRVSILSENGDWLAHIGKKGFGPGELSGPAALASDEQGYIYVVEFGNKRISKFSPDGEFIHYFGRRDMTFPGFLSPTGLAVKNGIVYVADSIAKKIYMFDSDGMFLGTAIESGLNAPESLKLFPDGALLVADTSKLLAADPVSGIVRELTAAGNSRIRYTGADMGRNGEILAANFTENEITVLASTGDLAAGFFVQIERVVNDRFPLVSVEISVHDIKRQPIIGLDRLNFVLSEKGYPVADLQYLGTSGKAATTDIAVLIERSPEAYALRDTFAAALADINKAMNENGGRIASIFSAAAQPVRERFDSAIPSTLDQAARATAHSPAWRFDLGLRLAATDLLARSKKRAVIFLSSGDVGELAFEQYSLSELAAYLANNNIAFYSVLAGNGSASEAVQYLCEQSGGQVLRLYRPEGIFPVLKAITQTPAPVYSFSYRCQLPSDFGRAFLPISAEVHLLERSGRDETGFFPPLK